MITIFLILISFWIGWIARDRYICRHIQTAASNAINNPYFLSGNALNHVRCLSILDSEDIGNIADSLPDDRFTDDTIIPIPIKRFLYYLIYTILKRHQD